MEMQRLTMELFKPITPKELFADIVEQEKLLKKIEKLADSPQHIIAGHDPLTTQMYQPIDSKGLEIYSLTQPI
jgi:hypothetical protein